MARPPPVVGDLGALHATLRRLHDAEEQEELRFLNRDGTLELMIGQCRRNSRNKMEFEFGIAMEVAGGNPQDSALSSIARLDPFLEMSDDFWMFRTHRLEVPTTRAECDDDVLREIADEIDWLFRTRVCACGKYLIWPSRDGRDHDRCLWCSLTRREGTRTVAMMPATPQ